MPGTAAASVSTSTVTAARVQRSQLLCRLFRERKTKVLRTPRGAAAANHRKQQGLSVLEAIKDAAAQRFRPILMTSLSTILGILPIALALGAGSESRVSMGVAVIGGLLFATVLTLYVIPVIYSFLSGKDNTVIDVERLLEEEKRREGVTA